MKHPTTGSRIRDYTGLKNHYLTALYPTNNMSGTNWKWMFMCDCGNVVEYVGSRVFTTRGSNKRNNTSCGCSKGELKVGILNVGYKGTEILNNRRLYSYRVGALKRSLEFNITIEYVSRLFEEQGRKCALTGLELTDSIWHQRKKTRDGNQKTASLDRIDSTKGYIEGNVQWLHKDVNLMKSNLPEDKFIEYCELITNNEKRKRSKRTS